MKGLLKTLGAAFMLSASSVALASSVPATDATPQMAYEDISRSLPALEPITFQASAEKHKLLVLLITSVFIVVSSSKILRNTRMQV
jgi:thiol:disulfide interchange protein DsbC